MLGIMTYSSCYPTTLLHIYVCWCVAAKKGCFNFKFAAHSMLL